MKLLLLAPGSVIHTQRWANGLCEAGVEVVCASQHDFLPTGWDARIERVRLPRSGPLGYFLNAPAVARLFRSARCVLLNAHYATGYGSLAALSGVRPRMISVWGSDVYDFPRITPLHRLFLRRLLARADAIASTSEVMAREVTQLLGPLWRKPVLVTPFGVDTERFSPGPVRSDGMVVIGTVKTLAPKYGIDTLLRGFALLVRRSDVPPSLCLRLRIVGDGPSRRELTALAMQLGIAPQVEFVGAIEHARVPQALKAFDIFVAASRLDSESFGVAVIEASACGLPVIVTRVGGLPEVVDDGVSGLLVDKESPEQLADAMAALVRDPQRRQRLGEAGRRLVMQRYEWRANVQTMIDGYRQLMAATRA